MDDIEQKHWARVQKFNRTLSNQRTGAASAVKGFDFQEMVSIVEILKLAKVIRGEIAANRPVANIRVEQNSDDAVDDLFITTIGYRRHVQIKGGGDPSWDARLVDAFWSDFFRYRHEPDKLHLELIVASEAAQEKMVRNMASHDLDRTKVKISASQAQLPRPFSQKVVKDLINSVSHTGWHGLKHQSMWSYLLGGWRDSGRSGSMTRVFREISKVSNYTIASLAKMTPQMRETLALLENQIPELKFAADGNRLLVRYRHGSAVFPPYPWKEILRTFDGRIPETLEEFEDVLGTRRPRRQGRK
ncbi:hypothetical protein R1538_05545 [Rhizobium leguminosarum]|uniref:hypothetical protein n=1 Tax=Rhizobium leguminosarum TaxID=384 RepID=UPI00293DA40D|nr:hypothetical protein [Rhizobium leguminosarum]MDV4160583.1 hypothetical protein [Rhizobium leguminosarum]MDV4170312.1 hypothetical protein [Rhizobium leguminosarum]